MRHSVALKPKASGNQVPCGDEAPNTTTTNRRTAHGARRREHRGTATLRRKITPHAGQCAARPAAGGRCGRHQGTACDGDTAQVPGAQATLNTRVAVPRAGPQVPHRCGLCPRAVAMPLQPQSVSKDPVTQPRRPRKCGPFWTRQCGWQDAGHSCTTCGGASVFTPLNCASFPGRFRRVATIAKDPLNVRVGADVPTRGSGQSGGASRRQAVPSGLSPDALSSHDPGDPSPRKVGHVGEGGISRSVNFLWEISRFGLAANFRGFLAIPRTSAADTVGSFGGGGCKVSAGPRGCPCPGGYVESHCQSLNAWQDLRPTWPSSLAARGRSVSPALGVAPVAELHGARKALHTTTLRRVSARITPASAKCPSAKLTTANVTWHAPQLCANGMCKAVQTRTDLSPEAPSPSELTPRGCIDARARPNTGRSKPTPREPTNPQENLGRVLRVPHRARWLARVASSRDGEAVATGTACESALRTARTVRRFYAVEIVDQVPGSYWKVVHVSSHDHYCGEGNMLMVFGFVAGYPPPPPLLLVLLPLPHPLPSPAPPHRGPS